MAGYTENREQNMEVKYLRKVLGQVDERIQVPESVQASSLMHLLDGIPEPAVAKPVAAKKEPPRRKAQRKWFSLQSGIAYAAAFALIVALFYSFELSKNNLGTNNIGPGAATSAAAGESSEAEPVDPANAPTQTGEDATTPTSKPQTAASAAEPNGPATTSEPDALGVGGAMQAALLLEQDGVLYYCRANDPSDPDKKGFPVSLEIVDQSTQELLAQVNIPDMQGIEKCFAQDGNLLLLGKGEAGIVLRAYSAGESGTDYTEQLVDALPGTLLDARLYQDTVHIVAMADENPENNADVVELPNAQAPDTCTVKAVNLETMETAAKAFVGAKGSVQLHNQNAYIHYEGVSEDGEPRDYIAQITLEGLSINLGTVS